MGEAKARGSFEDRKKAAIERKQKEYQERLKLRLEADAKMTPAERKARKDAQIAMAQVLAMAGLYIYADKNIWRQLK